MKKHLQEKEVLIDYEPKFREYGIFASPEKTSVQIISFCPWCGKKLPSSLGDQWFKEIMDELHIDPVHDEEKITQEYKSDSWWKQRGL
ncbi:MAG: hypothetical protein H7A32_04915 [Deltaproteobacteria bacterium]|nr:hypothetical protein [Deltaproteobacteria bacterium]